MPTFSDLDALPDNAPAGPDEYRRLREMLGLTAAELALVLEVSRETISRRERGLAAITREAWAAMQFMIGTMQAHQLLAESLPNDAGKSGVATA